MKVLTRRCWETAAALEAAAAAVAVALDLLVPTLVLLAMAAVSLLVRRTGLASLGLHRTRESGLAVRMLGFAGAWSLFQLGVTLPAKDTAHRHAWLEAMVDHPGLIQRPIITATDGTTVVGRDLESVARVIDAG